MRIDKILMTSVLLCTVSVAAFGQDAGTRDLPADYVSDSCSMFPDGNYADCCVQHDRAYFFGGNKAERRAADAALYRCVKSKGKPLTASIMWVGVRVGAVGFLPTPFRWGFGNDWKKPTDR